MQDAGINPSKWQAGKTKLFLKEPSTVSYMHAETTVLYANEEDGNYNLNK